MIDSETHKLLEAHGLTAYTIERQAGHVTEQAIVALLTEVQEEAESRLDVSYEAGYAKAQEDYRHELDAARAEARYEALVAACRQLIAAKNAWREFLETRRLETEDDYDETDRQAKAAGLVVDESDAEEAIRQALHDLTPGRER